MKKIFLIGAFAVMNIAAFATGHTVSVSGTNVNCNGLCNGSAGTTVSGGIGPFTFSWTGSSGFTSTAQNVVGLCAGTYTVSVTDVNDASVSTATYTVTQPPALMIDLTSADDYCGTSDGSVTMNA